MEIDKKATPKNFSASEGQISDHTKILKLESHILDMIKEEPHFNTSIKKFRKKFYFNFLFLTNITTNDLRVEKHMGQIHQDISIPPEIRTRSQIDGVTYEDEAKLRFFASVIILKAGILLRLPMLTIASAQIIMHRYYHKKSFLKKDLKDVVMTAVFAAIKLDEHSRTIRDIVSVFYYVFKEIFYTPPPIPVLDLNSSCYVKMKQAILSTEKFMLKDLGYEFYLITDHPHKLVLFYAKTLKVTEEVAQQAWNYVNDVYKTVICVNYPSHSIATACVYFAYKTCKTPMPNKPWWIIMETPYEVIIHIIAELQAFYRMGKVAGPDALNIMNSYLNKNENEGYKPGFFGQDYEIEVSFKQREKVDTPKMMEIEPSVVEQVENANNNLNVQAEEEDDKTLSNERKDVEKNNKKSAKKKDKSKNSKKHSHKSGKKKSNKDSKKHSKKKKSYSRKYSSDSRESYLSDSSDEEDSDESFSKKLKKRSKRTSRRFSRKKYDRHRRNSSSSSSLGSSIERFSDNSDYEDSSHEKSESYTSSRSRSNEKSKHKTNKHKRYRDQKKHKNYEKDKKKKSSHRKNVTEEKAAKVTKFHSKEEFPILNKEKEIEVETIQATTHVIIEKASSPQESPDQSIFTKNNENSLMQTLNTKDPEENGSSNPSKLQKHLEIEEKLKSFTENKLQKITVLTKKNVLPPPPPPPTHPEQPPPPIYPEQPPPPTHPEQPPPPKNDFIIIESNKNYFNAPPRPPPIPKSEAPQQRVNNFVPLPPPKPEIFQPEPNNKSLNFFIAKQAPLNEEATKKAESSPSPAPLKTDVLSSGKPEEEEDTELLKLKLKLRMKSVKPKQVTEDFTQFISHEREEKKKKRSEISLKIVM